MKLFKVHHFMCIQFPKILFQWLIDYDYDSIRLCLRTAATSRPVVHPLGDRWAWRAMVMMILAVDNSLLVHQSSLAVLPAETSGASRRNRRRSDNFACHYLKYLKGSLTCHKILWHGTSSFISIWRKLCCGFLSPLKIHRLVQVWTHDP
jgi:hypothetical protein